jgi:hypothetical protein
MTGHGPRICGGLINSRYLFCHLTPLAFRVREIAHPDQTIFLSCPSVHVGGSHVVRRTMRFLLLCEAELLIQNRDANHTDGTQLSPWIYGILHELFADKAQNVDTS